MKEIENIENMEILLIEDNPDDVKLTLKVLEKYEMNDKVYVAKDGDEALEFISYAGDYCYKLKKTRPKLILLDLNIPKTSGIEVAKSIKNNKKTCHIPIVVLSNSRNEKDIIESYKCGVNSYVTKPVKYEEFVQIFEDLVFYWLSMNKLPRFPE